MVAAPPLVLPQRIPSRHSSYGCTEISEAPQDYFLASALTVCAFWFSSILGTWCLFYVFQHQLLLVYLLSPTKSDLQIEGLSSQTGDTPSFTLLQIRQMLELFYMLPLPTSNLQIEGLLQPTADAISFPLLPIWQILEALDSQPCTQSHYSQNSQRFFRRISSSSISIALGVNLPNWVRIMWKWSGFSLSLPPANWRQVRGEVQQRDLASS